MKISCNFNLEFVGSSQVDAKKHSIGKLQCSICKIWIVSRKNFRTHQQRIHEGLKNFYCDFCSRSFFSKGEVRDHIQSFHLKYNLKFECTFAGCTIFKKTKTSLRKHKSYVHGKTEH